MDESFTIYLYDVKIAQLVRARDLKKNRELKFTFVLYRPSSKSTKLQLQVIKAIINQPHWQETL